MEHAELLKLPKIIYSPPPEFQATNNSNFLYYTCDVHTESGEAIPNLIFHFEFKPSGKGCNEKYALHRLGDSGDRRVFQIEVYDKHYLSHIEPSGCRWFGPHMHYDGRARKTTAKLDCREDHRALWMARFCRHTNITIKEQTGEFQRPLL
jgi:hypothetical protein